MEHILNVKAVKKKMKNPPKDYKMYYFFMGVPEQLTQKEVSELKKVLNKEHKKLLSSINRAKTAAA